MIIPEEQLTTIFCLIDDFCKEFEPIWRQRLLERKTPKGDKRRKRSSRLCMSEIMTLTLYFHISKLRTFKDYYTRYVEHSLRTYFPGLPTYSQFVRLQGEVLIPLLIFLQTVLGDCSGISFVDSTILTVCHPKRGSSHRVFRGRAKWGKTSVGWFFGFKLHLIINDRGELLSFMLTPGNVDDRKPVLGLAKGLWGKLCGDRGYISSKLFRELWGQGIQLITRLRKGMENKLMHPWDQLLLRKRGLIESVLNKLKSSCQIEHHRHRSAKNFLVNLFSGLAAYCCDPCKPTLGFKERDLLDQFVA